MYMSVNGFHIFISNVYFYAKSVNNKQYTHGSNAFSNVSSVPIGTVALGSAVD